MANSSMGPRWQLAMCKELGRLTQGYTCHSNPQHSVTGTDTCQFIHKHDIPSGKKPTYVCIVADFREQKADPYQVRCTMGGNLIDFPGEMSTKVADIITVKCLLNNIVSTTGAKAACIDIKDFYLNNDLPEADYIRLKADSIPRDFWEQYNLDQFVDADGYVHAKVWKGIYGLPQPGRVANDHLLPRLAAEEFNPTTITPDLFKHTTNSVIFTLVMDDFLVLYMDIADMELLAATLRQWYTITVDMQASKFCSMTLDWDYEQRHCTISIPDYVDKALQQFTHLAPAKPQHSPHPWVAPIFGASIQYAAPDDDSTAHDKHGIVKLQQVIGTLLFYTRAVDNTMLVALG